MADIGMMAVANMVAHHSSLKVLDFECEPCSVFNGRLQWLCLTLAV